MKNLDLQLPDHVVSALGERPEEQARLHVAIGLFSERRLSAGTAAEMLGITKMEFYELISARGISPFNYPVEDLDRDLAIARETEA